MIKTVVKLNHIALSFIMIVPFYSLMFPLIHLFSEKKTFISVCLKSFTLFVKFDQGDMDIARTLVSTLSACQKIVADGVELFSTSFLRPR